MLEANLDSPYSQIIKLYSLQFGVSQAQAKRLLEELSNMILLSLKQGSGEVNVPRLGVFSLKKDVLYFKPTHFAINYLNLDKGENNSNVSLDLSDDASSYLNHLSHSTNKEIEGAPQQPETVSDILLKGPAKISKAYYIKQIRRPNRPDPVRKSFLDYLKWGFAQKDSWKHPSGDIYPHDNIKVALEHYKRLNPHNYRALWTRWTSDQSREFIAENFGFSSSSIRRRWDEGISTILVMLVFPELTPENIVYLYGDTF
jgi:hypothetical protein